MGFQISSPVMLIHFSFPRVAHLLWLHFVILGKTDRLGIRAGDPIQCTFGVCAGVLWDGDVRGLKS